MKGGGGVGVDESGPFQHEHKLLKRCTRLKLKVSFPAFWTNSMPAAHDGERDSRVLRSPSPPTCDPAPN